MSKRAIITGITGQDGSYLAGLLPEQDCEAVGVARRLSGVGEQPRTQKLHRLGVAARSTNPDWMSGRDLVAELSHG